MYRTFAGILFLLLCCVPFLGLDYQSLWLDELYSMMAVAPHKSWVAMTTDLASTDAHPPLYFWLLRLWCDVWGHTAVAARALSALFSVLASGVIFLTVRDLRNSTSGIFAAILSLCTVHFLEYGQEARMYSLMILLSACFMWRMVKFMRGKIGLSRSAIEIGLLGAISLYVHYNCIFLITSIIFSFLIVDFLNKRYVARKNAKWFLGVLSISFVPFLLWLPVFLFRLEAGGTGWLPPPVFRSLVTIQFQLTAKELFFSVLSTIGIAVACFRIYQLVRTGSSDVIPIFLLLFIGLGALMPYVVSVTIVPVYQTRYLLFLMPALILLASEGLAFLPTRLQASVVPLLFISFGYTMYQRGFLNRPTKTQFRELVYQLKERTNYTPFISPKYQFFNYYVKEAGVTDTVVSSSEFLPDKTVHLPPQFWILSGHYNEGMADLLPHLEKYDKVDSIQLYDAYAWKYVEHECGACIHMLQRHKAVDSLRAE